MAHDMINTGNDDLDAKITEWLQWNKDQKAKEEIFKYLNNKDNIILSKLFLKRLEFGTAGLRGRMGPGYNQMNDIVIIQTGQGLTKYLMDTIPDITQKGVVIGYDGRYNSKRFAELTTAIFIANGIKVHLFHKICPTPFIPYTILRYKHAAGIMITASHNPKDDNGYKVYWQNGAQIISPHDKKIQSYILNNLKPLESSWNVNKIYESPFYKDPTNDIIRYYYEDLRDSILYPEINETTTLKFTYTAMHGVGYDYMKYAFDAANFEPFLVVEEQKLPDPEFSTVKYPNPEEGKSALDLSIKLANERGSSIILANDPDADRLACATKTKSGEWHIFSGNELGALLGWWMFHIYRVLNPQADLDNAYMLTSTVSSKILAAMAKKEGFNFEETLTGFKWMGNKAVDLMREGKDVLFAYEEAIGFMCGTKVLDKDGISAGIHVAELSAYLATQGLTLSDKLQEIYAEYVPPKFKSLRNFRFNTKDSNYSMKYRYGHHISDNSYWICYEPSVVEAIFERLRNYSSKPNTYPAGILEGKYMITSIRDLTTGYDSTKPNNKAVLPVSKSSQMITFTFENGLVTTLRTSGTEPKIKYYNELCASPQEKDVNKLKNILAEMVSAIITEFLQPQINALIPRGT